MKSNSEYSADGKELQIICMANKLWISLRRSDDRREPRFARFDGLHIDANEIATLLPNWRALSWTQQEDSDLSHGQWSAEEGDYLVFICGDPGGRAWHWEVMALWCRFMGVPMESVVLADPQVDKSAMQLQAFSADAFDSVDVARNWLNNPHPSLDGKAPIDCTKNELGMQKVRRLLAGLKRDRVRRS
jgi:hypothetical protein